LNEVNALKARLGSEEPTDQGCQVDFREEDERDRAMSSADQEELIEEQSQEIHRLQDEVGYRHVRNPIGV
jgi:hypothetical protein